MFGYSLRTDDLWDDSMMQAKKPGRRTTRRQWLAATAGAAIAAVAGRASGGSRGEPLRLWVTSDPHVGTDLWTWKRGNRQRRPDARESLAEAIRQSESQAGFDWDLALCLGDFSGNQDIPDDEEGRELVR